MSVLDERRAILKRTWRELLPSGTRCALALYPDHWNAGDAAIWLATRKLLAELDVAVDYACDPWSYDSRALQAALPVVSPLLAEHVQWALAQAGAKGEGAP